MPIIRLHIYMDEKFINEIKNKINKNICVGDYQIGRYAWILENTELINPKIDTKQTKY